MSETIKARLEARGITLPQAAAAAAKYVPYVQSGNLLFISGQLPLVEGKLHATGLVGRDIDVATAQKAAEYCGLNILAQASAALDGDLERIVRVVKLGGFVASTPDFTEQHLVVNGCSNFLGDILGDKGSHARFAVGASSLPLNACVEIDAVVEVR